MSDWKSRFAVLGVAASAVLAAKALRQLWLFAELGLLNPPVQKFKGAWALVTGGSEGVGKAVAAELARNGINVLLVSRSQAKLDAAAADIKRQHSDVQVRTFAADLTQRQQLDALLQHITHTSTHISLLVANAGGAVPRMTNYWQFSDDEEERMQALNGAACYVLVKALLPDMVQRGKGAVVAISSSMHRLGAFAAPYAAEKAKVNALIGRGGPLVMPYWGHSCSEALLLDVWWPPELGRFVAGSVARAMKSNLDARVDAAQSG
ncbi:hypothetical protein OEZ85_000757 [Tetradesmus obliquus]|uniref:Short-chain dehydrogenase n=1 Tax=Tetradesmus obliquus TaxID=3088 RepID=A0ABY8ULK3_TETOB|nr:hypothetical protein OEZ85_000757 [Tetradesmus obliquus]